MASFARAAALWPPFEHTLNRFRSEYRAMPGLSLTARQARRLFGLDDAECQSTLDCLVSEGFLRRTSRGTYCLAWGRPAHRAAVCPRTGTPAHEQDHGPGWTAAGGNS